MKATLYRLPARNMLVLQANDGTFNIEYPPTEVRAHQLAQDAGVKNLTFGRVEDLIAPKKARSNSPAV